MNDSNAAFSSTWDIDQLVDSDTVAVSSGDTSILTISGSSAFEVQFQPSGSSKWYGEGLSSTNNTLAGTFVFYSYQTATALHVVTPSAGTVRYFVWADTVVH